MKKIILLPALLACILLNAQNVGIGTTTPNAYGKLHVHNAATFDASISLTNGLTTDAELKGARFRMLNSDLNIINYEATGKLNLTTGFNIRMTVDDAGNVGIGTTTPSYRLHVLNTTASAFSAIQTTAAGERAELQFLGDNNPFNTLFIQKYAPGAGGTFGGISKDNLSVISTGGNAGTLLIGTGDGVSPIVFVTGTGETVRMLANGQVAIGTNTPASTGKLHIHDDIANQDVSLVLTNSLTGPNNLRGMRLRLLNSDITLSNYEPTGSINFSTAFNTRMTIDAVGNVGIGTTAPNHFLDIAATGAAYGINVEHSSSNVRGIASSMGNNQNTIGVLGSSFYNSAAGNYAIGIHGISGQGGSFLSPTDNYGVVGESRNAASGIGVLGSSTSPSPFITQAAILGINFSTAASTYGIIGFVNGSSGAGVVGKTTNATTGLLGYATSTSTGPAIKSASSVGSSLIGLELENGAIKVSGTNRTVFQHVTTAGNIISNETVIPNTTLANSATDMLIVTPVWEGVYINAPIGVYFSGGSWRIFRQDLAAMPVGVKFNVLVVKQ